MKTYLSKCLFGLLLLAGQLQAVPDIQQWQTNSGAKVLLISARELPMLDIQLVFRAGSAYDQALPGLAVLTNALLTAGTTSRSEEQIATDFDQVGAIISQDVQRDSASIGLRSLSNKSSLQPALDVLRDILINPTFPLAALERDQQRLLRSLEFQQQQPNEVGENAFYAALYRDHPYANPIYGTPVSITQISRDDLQRFQQRYYVARNMVIAIVGDIERAAAVELVDKLLQGIPTGESATVPAMPKPLAAAMTERIDMPTSQTLLQLGHIGIAYNDPDYWPLFVGNHILGGGGFSARLMQVLREDNGLTYGIRSGFATMLAAGPFMISMQTQNSQTQQALELIRATLQDFIQQGPTAEEMEQAINNITGSFPLTLDSNRDLVGILAVMGFYQLPLDYLQTYNQKIRQVTAAQVKAAFQRHINPDAMLTVIVGGN